MRKIAFSILKYFFFWIIIFVVQKILFLLFNYQEASELSLKDLLLVIVYGLKLDVSMAAYISIIPVILIIAGTYLNKRIINLILKVYTFLLLFIILFMGVVDMELYSYWGFKLDITPLIYIKTPGDALASINPTEIILLVALFFFLFFLSARVYRKFFNSLLNNSYIRWYFLVPSGLLSLLILFILARGGIGISAMNLSHVYFHQERFANHSAINVTWNTLYSFLERKKLQTSQQFMDAKIANDLVDETFSYESELSTNIVKPGSNILLIVLESFSNKIISALGGEDSITPNLNKLAGKSVVFNNFYASGDRSDKGLVSIFSGYPAQPTTSIIDYPSKSQKLPFMYKPFSENGYETAFYYGGDLNFANFKSYFSNPYVDRLVTKDNFSSKDQKQKWGVPDGILFDRLKSDIDKTGKPFFYSCFTLSSHEPFDVPMKPVFGTKNRDQLSKNGFYYSDSVLNDFLSEAEKSAWWDKTLIIITADHGSRSPGNTQNHSREKFHIPMLWTGGALLLKDSTIHTAGSQTDIPATILSLFGYDYSMFDFSRNLLNKNLNDFAYYAFNNGFGCITPSGYVIYDIDFNKCLIDGVEDSHKSLETGKALLQLISSDFLKK